MKFDNNAFANNENNKFLTIESILEDLDLKSTPVVESDVPALFSQLVENLRYLNLRELTHLYEANKASRVWRFLIDAAPMVATSSSTALVADLITSNQMTNEEADIWFTSLAFVPNPDTEMFAPLPVSDRIQ